MIVVSGGADAGISPGGGGGAGSRITGAELGSEGREEDCTLGVGSAGSLVAGGSSCIMELIRGGKLTSALGTGWVDGGASGGP